MTDGSDADDGGDDRPTGIVRAILDLLAEMDERGERTRHGHWSGDRAEFDYSVSVGGLDEAFGPGRREDREGRDDRDDRRPPAVTTREADDGLVVVADLPGVPEEAVGVDLDRDERAVLVSVDGEVLGRVPLDDGDWTVTDVSVNNGVLEARVARE